MFEFSPSKFFRIAKNEPFRAPKWLKATFLNPAPVRPEPFNFPGIATFEPFGAPKWLNLTF